MTVMDTQAAYEKIREHFTRPDAVRAVDPEKSEGKGYDFCVYRLGKERTSPVRCAFGVLIPDHMYNPKWENVVARELLSSRRTSSDELKEYLAHVDKDFIERAQSAHDRSGTTLEEFLIALDKIASDFGLKVVQPA